MCRNGRYTERGIKQIDGYASEQWTVEADYAVKLDDRLEDVGVLMEPTTVVAKAWEQVERVGARAWFEPEPVLVTGGRPDRPARRPARRAARARRARPRPGDRGREAAAGARPRRDLPPLGDWTTSMARVKPDVVIEATGRRPWCSARCAGPRPTASPCLTGVSSRGRTIRVDAGELNRDIVLENDAVVGSVNANLRHYAPGRRGAGRGRPRLAGSAGHPAGAARRLRGRVRAAARRRQGRAHPRRERLVTRKSAGLAPPRRGDLITSSTPGPYEKGRVRRSPR